MQKLNLILLRMVGQLPWLILTSNLAKSKKAKKNQNKKEISADCSSKVELIPKYFQIQIWAFSVFWKLLHIVNLNLIEILFTKAIMIQLEQTLLPRLIIFWSAPCEDSVQAAVVEGLYLPNVPVPVHHIEMFYNLAVESDRELSKLPLHRPNQQPEGSGENGYLQLSWGEGDIPAVGWLRRPDGHCLLTACCHEIPVCQVPSIATGPWSTLRGKAGFSV